MAARIYRVPLDMTKLEIQNQVVHTLASAPSAPVKFQLYGNSTDNTLYWWDGTQWVAAKGAAGAVPSDTVTTQAVGDAAVPGASTLYSRGDHKHAREAFGPAIAETIFGGAKADGSALTVARSDHAHGNPTHVAADHSTIPLSSFAVPTTAINMNGQAINNVATPVAGTDAANKAYVDNSVAGLSWKDSVRVASTTNSAASGLIAVDGVTVASGDRVLLKNQGQPEFNGIFIAASGIWPRSTDADTATELQGMAVFVEEGTTNADTAWVLSTNAPITVNTTSLTYVQFAGGGAVTGGAGLTQSGNTLNVGAGVGVVVNADDVQVNRVQSSGRVPLLYSIFVGTGALTTITVTHNLNASGAGFDVICQVYDSATGAQVECDVKIVDANNLQLIFAIAPAANAYKAVIYG